MPTENITLAERTNSHRILRWLADAYEQSQRLRIETGERIRAVLQGRDETWSVEGDENVDADAVLAEIAKGESDGPVPILGVTYRRHKELEDAYRKNMTEALHAHPAWPWLEQVRGIGPTLACKLLARFDAEKAQHASSYWCYAGLGTVPAHRYECPECGLVSLYPVTFDVTGKHKALGTQRNCKGKSVVSHPYDEATDYPRCAQPRPGKGQKAPYDQYAKKVMFLVGTSFLKAGGPYEEIYRRERNRLERERPGWADGRKHYTALRKIEKLFLSHLWEVTRTNMGLPVAGHYAQEHMGHNGRIDPWDMVGK